MAPDELSFTSTIFFSSFLGVNLPLHLMHALHHHCHQLQSSRGFVASCLLPERSVNLLWHCLSGGLIWPWGSRSLVGLWGSCSLLWLLIEQLLGCRGFFFRCPILDFIIINGSLPSSFLPLLAHHLNFPLMQQSLHVGSFFFLLQQSLQSGSFL